MKFLSVIVLLITYYLLFITSASAHSTVQIIKMTPNDFEPSEVTIDENSAVIFVNEDKVPRWPASNLHPTHDLYPEFDPKKAINPGENWSFKPKKAGVWKYHDHLNPHVRATLTVTPEPSSYEGTRPAPNIIESLKNYFSSLINKMRSLLSFQSREQQTLKPEDFKKQTSEEQFKKLNGFSKAQGAEKAWTFITETFKGEAGSTGNIHDLAHLAGKLIYEDKGISGIGTCTPIFAFGCYHGLLDAAFRTSLADLPQAEKECEKLGPVGSGPYGSCIHGIGHGVASFHQSKDINKALLDCDLLRNGREFCHDGVFMEFVRSAPPDFYTKSDPFYPCNSLEKENGNKYSLACGRNQASVFISKLAMKFEDAAKLCNGNKLDNKFKNACFESLGFMLASSGDTSQIIAGCQSVANTTYSDLCLKAAAGELIFQNVSGWQEKAPQVCNSVSNSFKNTCQEHLQRLIKEYGKETESKFILYKDGESSNIYVRNQMAVCYEGGSTDDCYKYAASLFSEQFGLRKTLDIFQKNEDYPAVYARCHETTHYLSRNEYKKTGSIPMVYAQCDSTCHGGCYHGALEAYLKEKEEAFEDMPEAFGNICGKSEDYDKPLVFNECHHGLGHAAMFVTDMEVPESLSLCDTLTRQEDRERCYSGVFMENSSSSTNNDHPGRWVKTDDPLFPCNSLDQKYAKLCYRYQSSHFALITNHNWQETVRLCLSVPEQYRDECFRTIGTNQVGFTQDTGLMRKNCALAPNSHFQEVCLQGVISSFAYRFVGDIGRMENFCLEVSDNYQKACFRQAGTSVIDWVKDKKEALGFCNKILNPKFSGWCKAAIPS
ncbi:MAG: hypothetical protein HYS83_01335 [Candidatus Blackburnbacteria bacterium]|nr:hypothetical protein [Candidatus Blackburnbacteria bacterium]